MTREELLQRLRALKPWLSGEGINELRLFGSFARDQAKDDSDVDLMVEFDRPLGLRFFTIEQSLAEKLDRKVDFTTERALHPIVRKRALADAILV